MSIRRLASLATLGLFLSLTSAVKAASPEIGADAPNFTLSDTNGKSHSLSDFKGKYVVLEWINYGCPFVRKHYDTGNMQKLQKDYGAKNVVWLGIASSAKGKEGYFTADEWNVENKKEKFAGTAVLLDEQGTVGKSYDAKTTPHMYIINPEGKLVYKGAIDSIKSYKKEDVKKANNYVKAALDESLAGKPVSTPTTEAYGCSVKYN